MRLFDEMMVSSSHIYFFQSAFGSLHVFDRQVTGKLLQTLALPDYHYYDRNTNTILGFSRVDSGCQISYLNLETLVKRDGLLVKNQTVCSWRLVHQNITDQANPFFIYDLSDKGYYLLVSPATYGVISWTPPDYLSSSGIIIPGDAGTSFSFVYTSTRDPYKRIRVNSYKLNKPINTFTLQDSYYLTTVQTNTGEFAMIPILNSKIVMTYDQKITIIDLIQKTDIAYDVPAFYYSENGVRVLYDKNKTPYLLLSEEDVGFGQLTTPPQLFDFANFKPVPEAIDRLTRTATVVGSCSYSLIDEYNDNIGVLRFYDVCNSTQTLDKIYV